MKTHLFRIISAACLILGFFAFQSCEKPWIDEDTNPSPLPTRTDMGESRHCMILYSAGFNSLSSYLRGDIEDLQTGYLPTASRYDDIVMIVSRLTTAARDYSVNTSPVIIRLYKDMEGNAVMDTVKTLSTSSMLSDAAVMRQALEFIQTNYPSKDYGMIVSSHATGWLPQNYYSSPKAVPASIALPEYVEPVVDDRHPMVKSICMDVQVIGGYQYAREMELRDFREAIPMHLKYLMFDACLMGGIEVAYELKDIADLIGFSQTEVLADGLDYPTVLERLIGGNEPDPVQVAKDYMDIYQNKEGVYNSATYSVVDCSHLEELAEACEPLFDKYRSNLAGINAYDVQQYYRDYKHWYYDMEDILVVAGVPDSEMVPFRSALDKCILYKDHTHAFMEEFDINRYSGLSMFLPCHSSSYLRNEYKNTSWNKRTQFVN